MDFTGDSTGATGHGLTKYVVELQQLYRFYLDKVTPHEKERWIAFGVLQVIFFLRIIYGQGWYAICYSFYIFSLNQFLAFLTPKFDMSLQQEEANERLEAGGAPDEQSEEFRPFIRRLPEFKFWYNVMRGGVIALVLTFSRVTDIPVYWPILLIYFVILFALTMRRQIQHMIKYKYVPLDLGKKKYTAPSV
ncbi:protein Rer1p [Monosporozyma unispora]|nr:retention in endoplasmic reticulum protein 1 [Kazachstania unispora]